MPDRLATRPQRLSVPAPATHLVKTMNRHRCLATSCLLVPLLLLAGCSSPSDQNTLLGGHIADRIQNATDKTREGMADKKLRLENDPITLSAKGQPDAQITPSGELIIDGQPVALTDAQQALVLRYRQQLILLVNQGMAIGLEGAELGLGAAKTAIGGLLGGRSSEQIEADIQSQASRIKDAARSLCDQLPELGRVQDELASQLPAFAPYAAEKHLDARQCLDDVASAD